MEKEENQECPVCFKEFVLSEIQYHVNKCLFLNTCNDEHLWNQRKRKRSPSPQSTNNDKYSNVEFSVNTTNYNNLQLNLKACHSKENDSGAYFKFQVPLTRQLQPKSLKEFFGQDHVLGKNTFLRSLLEENNIPSIILWGPPGCGKTSLANVICEICNKSKKQYKYVSVDATSCSISEIRSIVNNAKQELKSNRRTIIFIDEIHRFDKKHQNSFTISVAKGELILIGATTENPSFTLNNTLLNRCKVIVMEKLESAAMVLIIKKALDILNIHIIDDTNTLHNLWLTQGFRIHHSAVKWLADTSDGDARIALNNLQLVLQHNNKETITISKIKDEIKKSHLLYDRNGEEHHNIISAMHESIKGYNDNAALYWTTRMIMGGEDHLFLARRLVRAASEDTGNRDPKALQLAVSTMQACQLIGATESDVLLAQCAVYLARAPTDKKLKSSLALAKEMISKKNGQLEVPLHLRNLPSKLLAELVGTENLEEIKQSFMPVGLENVNFL